MTYLLEVFQCGRARLCVRAERPFFHEALPIEVEYDVATARSFMMQSSVPADWLIRSAVASAEGMVVRATCTVPTELLFFLASYDYTIEELLQLSHRLCDVLERVYMSGGRLCDTVRREIRLFKFA